MRSKFPGHFRASDAAIKKLWETGIIVFDANVLLNFYRYSDSSRTDFFRLLDTLGSRIWIPHQSCKEFLNNRLGTIIAQESEYAGAVSDLDAIEKKFSDERSHPFLPTDLLARLGKVFGEVRRHLNSEKESLGKRTSDDPVLAEIEKLIGEKIGDGFSPDQIALIYKEGADRYKRRIPPGYKDGAKAEEAGDERKFGDLVLWKEILAKTAEKKVGVIFVTDDRKEDWWLFAGPKTVGPRPELVAEFKAASGSDLLMYQPHRFLEYAKKFLGEAVTTQTIEEARVRREETVPVEIEKYVAELEARRQSMRSERAFLLQRREALLREEAILCKRMAEEDPSAISWDELQVIRSRLKETEAILHKVQRSEEDLLNGHFSSMMKKFAGLK